MTELSTRGADRDEDMLMTEYNSIAAAHITSNDPNGWMFANDPDQIFLTTTTTLNGVVTSDFTSTAGAYGKIWARRIK